MQRFRALPHAEQVRQADRWSEMKPGHRARAIAGFWPAVGKMLHELEGARNTLIMHKVSLCPVHCIVLAGCGRDPASLDSAWGTPRLTVGNSCTERHCRQQPHEDVTHGLRWPGS